MSADSQKPSISAVFNPKSYIRRLGFGASLMAATALPAAGCGIEDDSERRSIIIDAIKIIIDVIDIFLPIAIELGSKNNFKAGVDGEFDLDLYLMQFNDTDCMTDPNPATVDISHLHGEIPAGGTKEFTIEDLVIPTAGTYKVRGESYDPVTKDWQIIETDCFIVTPETAELVQ